MLWNYSAQNSKAWLIPLLRRCGDSDITNEIKYRFSGHNDSHFQKRIQENKLLSGIKTKKVRMIIN